MTATVTPLVLAALLLTGCQQYQRPRASQAATVACRAEVDRVYAAQNRVDLSTRDQRDTPFAANFQTGNTTRGLSSEYGRDNQFSSCLNSSAAPGPAPAVSPTLSTSPGPAFSPAVK